MLLRMVLSDLSAISIVDDDLKESTVRGWKSAYLEELQKQKRSGNDDLTITELPHKKIRRPLLLD